MTRPNGVTSNYTYNNLSQLLSVLHQVGTSTIDGAVYTVDPAGNRTAKTDEHANVTSDYTYDPLYELTQVTQTTNTTETYSYDPVGNRLSSLAVSPYSFNTSNELTSIPGTTYTYDSNGNTLTKVTSSGTTGYGWDYENRLASVALPGTAGTLAFKYDGLGRRVQKTFSQGSSVTTTNYLYDGDNAAADVDQNGNVLARYIFTQNIDEPLAELRSGTTSYYSQDGLGSVTSLTTSAGSIGNAYGYDSFGNLTASSGSIVNRFQYTGREFDSETGLYFYRARFYDPITGRFISEDPIRFGAGQNFYAYVGNDPIVRIDPLGLDWLKNLSDFSAGAGSVLSVGLTDAINNATGASSVVDKCSGWHKLGTGTGIALLTAIGGAAGAEAAEANAGVKGFEFSHWYPNRWGGPRSVWNGNFVSGKFAYLTDPYRYPSPAGAALRWGPKLNPAFQQILRIPWVYDGAAAGAAVGGASAALTGANCGCN